MPDPIFDSNDKPGKKKLPAHLVGKSPEEIAEYYDGEMQATIARAREIANRRQPEKPAETAKPAEDDTIDIWGKPADDVKRIVRKEIIEATNRVAATINPNMINTCRLLMKERHADWPRWQKEVEEIISRGAPDFQMNVDNWDFAYQTVRGRHVDELSAEAVEASKRPKSPIEMPTPGGASAAKPEELTPAEKAVAAKYDITEEQYQGYKTKYDETEGILPFTYDSRKPRKRKAS